MSNPPKLQHKTQQEARLLRVGLYLGLVMFSSRTISVTYTLVVWIVDEILSNLGS